MKSKLLRRILIGVGIVVVLPIALILILASMKPNTFMLKREIVIKASPETVYPLINNFRNWTAWSPWEKLDPNLKRIYSGADHGVGAIYEWQGNDNVGQGRMEIKEAKSPEKVTIDLHFLKPFEASNIAEFTLTPKDDSTQVVWEMRGPSPFMFKVMDVCLGMDNVVGKDFDSGLAAMKAKAESEPAASKADEKPPEQPEPVKAE